MTEKPLFAPQTEWLPPIIFPDLRDRKEISIDLETKDPFLKSHGSGSIVGRGCVTGIAVAIEGWAGYYPIAHEGGGNMDKKTVLKWLKEVLLTPADKIFHNAMYDVCWLRAMGFKINGRIIDTMIATSLIDENRGRYDLNSVCKDYIHESKNEYALQEAAKSWGVDPKQEMYKLPAIYVGEYAEKDAELTLKLWQACKHELQIQDVWSMFDLETSLTPCLIDMRFKGVRVDTEEAERLKKMMGDEEKDLLQSIKKETGINVQIWAAASIATVFDKLNEPYERTIKTQAPSFTKNFLANHSHPIVKKIAEAREINKAHTTFIDTILKHVHKGRIHADINQLRGDSGGTITGRFSYQNPNLQQIPARNKDLGPIIRRIFIPEKDHLWGCFDYNQQEPRLVVHYALLQKLYGVDKIADAYKEDNVDFHKIVARMADIPRRQAKTINLGLFYGMGKAKLQAQLGVSKEKAAELLGKYHTEVPFVQQLLKSVMNRAQDRGQIRTLLGRLCRFHLWEPNQFGMHKALSHDAALKEHGPGIRRAYTYKALNKLIQGSAADMTKKAMIDLHKEGIIPHIQVHDELDISIKNKKDGNKIKEIMENAVNLEIPNKVDYEYGDNWGEIK
jgi:DNA polymerase I-like protein with 3'-5' exonuclease and polymerase domains